MGHVQKRLGKRLRDLKKKTFKDDTGRVLNLKWGGKNRFTDKTIDMLKIFYGGAIRNNTQNVDAMYKAIWAVFFYDSATDEIHDHSYCPTGEDSLVQVLQGCCKESATTNSQTNAHPC